GLSRWFFRLVGHVGGHTACARTPEPKLKLTRARSRCWGIVRHWAVRKKPPSGVGEQRDQGDEVQVRTHGSPRRSVRRAGGRSGSGGRSLSWARARARRGARRIFDRGRTRLGICEKPSDPRQRHELLIGVAVAFANQEGRRAIVSDDNEPD